MLQLVESLKPYLEALLAQPDRTVTVSFVKHTANELPRVVLIPQDAPLDRDSESFIEHTVMEVHCVAGTPEEAVRMMDLVCDDLAELLPGGLVIRGETLTGCENIGQRSVSDQTDTEDTFDALSSWKFTTEKPRKKKH